MRKQGLERMGGTEVESYDRELPFDDSADLDQFQADRLAGGLGEFGAGERKAPNRLQERVREAR